MTNGDTTDEDPVPPRITDAPKAIWLNYGDLEHDDTHWTCCRDGEVTWCEDKQFESDVCYVREDVSELKQLRELADSEGTRAVEYLRRAKKAEEESERLRSRLHTARAYVARKPYTEELKRLIDSALTLND